MLHSYAVLRSATQCYAVLRRATPCYSSSPESCQVMRRSLLGISKLLLCDLASRKLPNNTLHFSLSLQSNFSPFFCWQILRCLRRLTRVSEKSSLFSPRVASWKLGSVGAGKTWPRTATSRSCSETETAESPRATRAFNLNQAVHLQKIDTRSLRDRQMNIV